MRSSVEHRRLLALLIGDIAGYSRLMAEHEADTFYRVKDLQTSLIVPTVERNRGRIVKWTGDGFIATFESAVDAVRAAVEIQSGAAAAGAASPEDRRLWFRMGVNVGDVIVAPGDVYGDAVNVTDRLQGLAPPGGICVSRGVRDAVRGKFGIEFEDKGAFEVKSIPEPVSTYGVIFDPVAWTMERPQPLRQRLGRPASVIAAAAVILLLTLGGAGWFVYERGSRASLFSPAEFREALQARLATATPGTSPQVREEQARAYVEAKEHKAQAASAQPPGTWRAADRASAEAATEAALESCHVAFGNPCALLAVDSALQPLPVDGKWPTRDMARSRYAGPFDPEQIPGASPGVRRQAAIVAYSTAPGAKAAVYTPSAGRIFIATSASDQRAAEQQAFAACEADPQRRRFGAPCFLYAVANQVVLPRRLREPVSGTSFRDGLLERFTSVLPGLSPDLRAERVRSYEQAQGHKAQAAAPETTASWWVERLSSPEAAEERALESCQVHAGQPCVLLAVNDRLQPIAGGRKRMRRDMPRVHYDGPFDPERIPAVSSQVRRRDEVVGYRVTSPPKAAALHPSGRMFVAVGAQDQRAAEEQALSACKLEIARLNVPSRCFLYASADQVVLSHRKTEPITPPALGTTRMTQDAPEGSIRLSPPPIPQRSTEQPSRP